VIKKQRSKQEDAATQMGMDYVKKRCGGRLDSEEIFPHQQRLGRFKWGSSTKTGDKRGGEGKNADTER